MPRSKDIRITKGKVQSCKVIVVEVYRVSRVENGNMSIRVIVMLENWSNHWAACHSSFILGFISYPSGSVLCGRLMLELG